jgi:hypothetical protein
MASGAVAARVVEWAGGLKEVQLPRDAAPEDCAALVRAALEQTEALQRGDLRRVRKPPPTASAAPAAPAALNAPAPSQPGAAAAAPAGTRRTTATDYAGWELALQAKRAGSGPVGDGSDSEGDAVAEEDQWELQPVSEKERRAEAARAAAVASATAHREHGNAAFKRCGAAGACRALVASVSPSRAPLPPSQR